tara:strand:- start:4844 stop:5671 length:828 start_codon:yes stop_codon:yes gene_type:complete
MKKKINLNKRFLDLKRLKQPLSMITCYDYPSAQIVEKVGLDSVLVGDSLGTNVLGYKTEKDVTIADMIHHTKAVSRGLTNVGLVADLPYGTYQNLQDLVHHAILLDQAGADAIKFEGFFPDFVKCLCDHNMTVVCHLGLLPQTHEKKYIQANSYDSAARLIQNSKQLEQMGASMLILELVPEEIACLVSQSLTIPVVGIAAGRFCDGQVQIWHDVLGLNDKLYKHISNLENLNSILIEALRNYRKKIKTQTLLTYKQSFHVDHTMLEDLRKTFNL